MRQHAVSHNGTLSQTIRLPHTGLREVSRIFRTAAALVVLSVVSSTVACSLAGDPSPSSQDAKYELVSIAGQPLPFAVFTGRVDDGTMYRLVVDSARLTLGTNGQMTRTTSVRRLIDSEVIQTEVFSYAGTFERSESTIVVRFRPLDMYDDVIEYFEQDGGQTLSGLESRGRNYRWRRLDTP